MSKKINVNDLSDEMRQQISTDLAIRLEESKYSMSTVPKYIYPFDMTETDLIVPYAYGIKAGIARPALSQFPKAFLEFNGTLRKEQLKVRTEAISHLNKYGCTLIAAYPGFGKCLKLDTPVIMYDGTIKMVQDIVKGEMLMGDDSTPRNVLSTCIGQEKMYEIVPTTGEAFGCNETHILSLKCLDHKTITSNNNHIVKWLDKKELKIRTTRFYSYDEAISFLNTILEDDIVDITVKKYLSLPANIKCRLKLYRVSVEFQEKKIDTDPYLLGLWLGNTGGEVFNDQTLIIKDYSNICINNKHIPYVYKCNSRINRLSLLAGIIDSNGYLFNNCYEIIKTGKNLANDIVYLARSLGFVSYIKEISIYIYGKGLEDLPVQLNHKKAISKNHDNVSEFQIVPIKDTIYYGFCIDGNRRFLLGDFTVTHNTCLALNIATKLKLNVLIITHRIVLINQWKDAIKTFCPNASIQVLTSKSKNCNGDFNIMNASNVPKMTRSFFKTIGFLVVDEAHIIVAEKMSKSLQMICPRYSIALTATPTRPDGLDVLLDLYFGKRRIFRKLYRKHTVYKIETTFKPESKKNSMGMLDWNAVIESQGCNKDRNDMIIRLVTTFSDLVILILCKRIVQANYLFNGLKDEGVDVTSLIGKQQTYEKTSRVLVGIVGKTGVGFDHKRINTLILASDVEGYFIQYLGRCMRTEEVVPIIFDIVDDQHTLKRHFSTRQKVYFEHGGIVQKFQNKFPNFKVI